MKITGNGHHLLLIACLLATTSWGQTTSKPPAPPEKPAATDNIHTPDDPDMVRDTQLAINANGRAGLVWWMPFEFWIQSGEKQGTPAEKTRESLKALQEYTIAGIFMAKVSSLGAFDYFTPADLQKATFLRDSDGHDYAALTDVTGDAKNLADVMRPMLANALGPAGTNFAMIFFPAKAKDGKRIADAVSKGRFAIVIKDIGGEPETIFQWRTPLTSLSAPRYCPAGKERVHADWEYCPWHGVKLENKQ